MIKNIGEQNAIRLVRQTKCSAPGWQQLSGGIHDAARSQGSLELNAMRPINNNNSLHSARILGDGCQKFREYSVEGTKINKEQVAKYVGESVMLDTALSPVIGYDKASKIAYQAMDTGSTLKDAALKNGVDEAEYDKVINPREMAGHGVGGA